MNIKKIRRLMGAIATSLGKALLAATEAGGGMAGLAAGVGTLLGPAGIAALAAVALYGAYKWFDYASGAAAARDALAGMAETANDWQNTQAKTIYDTGNDPFARFGVEASAFSSGSTAASEWLASVNKAWSDGEKDSKESVKGYEDAFVSGSDEIRQAIEHRQEVQTKYGEKADKTTTSDLKKLKSYDKEVAALLKKRRNKTLTEDEQKRLEQIIQERVEIKLRYTTGEGGGFESITKAVEAEKARLASEGQKPGTDLYGDALSAASLGYKEQVDSINQSYSDQYIEIMAITDEKKRQDALDQLNLEHVQALKTAREEYNKLLGQYGKEAFQSPEVKQGQGVRVAGLVIIRAGYGQETVDPRFLENVQGAIAQGIPFAVYWYSYAKAADGKTAVQRARNEAASFYRVVSPYIPRFWLLDAEEACLTCESINAFLVRIRALSGGKIGAYIANHRFVQYGVDTSLADFVMIPRGNSIQPTHRPLDLWQYSFGSRVPGIGRNVDQSKIPECGRFPLEWFLAAPAQAVADVNG